MSGRTGLRRAKVLLALDTMQPKTISKLARETGLKYGAVEGVLDALSRQNLVTLPWEGEFVLGRGREVDAAVAEARKALAEAQALMTAAPQRVEA